MTNQDTAQPLLCGKGSPLKLDLPHSAVPMPPLTGAARTRALAQLMLVDHGFLRAGYLNLHAVDEQLWRSAHPGPGQLRRARDRGIRTILNLRGMQGENGVWRLERDACEALGLTLINFPLRSRSALERETLLAALDLFASIDYPALMHCKSGADRTGLMAVLYLHGHRGVPLPDAMRHLSLRYGHIRQARTGIVDYLFARYADETAGTGESLRDWITHRYDPGDLNHQFRENRLAAALVDHVLRRE